MAAQASIAHRYSSPDSVRHILDDLGYVPDFQWAFDHYKPTIVRLARDYNLTRHVEIGAGRDPLFNPEECASLGFEVTLNDVSADELALAPEGYPKVQCDIISDKAVETLGREAYDFAYCRMVMEHVVDVETMWKNIYEILAPGGMAFSFFPTLYAPPYVLNRAIPDRLSRLLLETISPDRRPDGDNPKFPAFYDWCFADENKIAPMLRRVGFSQISVLPFWGYSYFWKFPVIKQIDAAFTHAARRRNWQNVSSFAYLFVTK